jgi:hypothetical protein
MVGGDHHPPRSTARLSMLIVCMARCVVSHVSHTYIRHHKPPCCGGGYRVWRTASRLASPSSTDCTGPSSSASSMRCVLACLLALYCLSLLACIYIVTLLLRKHLAHASIESWSLGGDGACFFLTENTKFTSLYIQRQVMGTSRETCPANTALVTMMAASALDQGLPAVSENGGLGGGGARGAAERYRKYGVLADYIYKIYTTYIQRYAVILILTNQVHPTTHRATPRPCDWTPPSSSHF